jgi:hypothetical protein
MNDSDATADAIGAERTAEGLAHVCANLDQISAALAGEDGRAVLERLRSALRGNEDITGPLDDINHALLHAGDALGVYGHRRSVPTSLPGVNTDRPLEIVYLCPAQRCARIDPGPAVPPPQCRLTGEPLLWDRL